MRRWSTLGLCLVLLSACSAANTSKEAPVPWIDSAGARFVPQPVPTTAPPASAPPCRAGQVRETGRTQNGGGGHLDQTFSFTNTSSSPCLLRGVPEVTASGPGHAPVVAASHGGFFVRTDLPSGDMDPGGTTQLTLESNKDCPEATASSSSASAPEMDLVTVELPAGGGTVRFPAALEVICGLYTGSFFLPPAAESYRPAPWAGLKLRLELPPSVKAGETLHYVVDLDNPTGRTVILDPCPSYTQGINRAGKVFLLLNCRQERQIGAHMTVRYAMNLAVPSQSVVGTAKVYWAFSEPAASATTGAVDVVDP